MNPVVQRSLVLLAGLALLVALGGPITAQGSASYVVIVNSDNPVTEISKSQLSGFLLKKKSKWDHGVSVDPADLDSGSSVREALSEDVHGRSVSSIKNYWQRQIFSGRGVPPPEVGDDAEMIEHVSQSPGAIGYVSSTARIPGDVKTVRVVG